MKGAAKSTPNLPSSSRLKSPSASGAKAMPKKAGSMKGGAGTTKKVMAMAKSKSSSKKGY
jgi:hypothetical protein